MNVGGSTILIGRNNVGRGGGGLGVDQEFGERVDVDKTDEDSRRLTEKVRKSVRRRPRQVVVTNMGFVMKGNFIGTAK